MSALPASARSAISDELNRTGTSFLAGVERTAKVEISDDDGVVVLTVVIEMTGGRATVLADGLPDEAVLRVRLDVVTAAAVGTRRELLADAFGDGRLTVDHATADDFGLSPLLETLFEQLVEIGAVAPGDARAQPMATESRPAGSSAFTDVDASGLAVPLLHYLDYSRNGLEDLKRRMGEILGARRGDRVLDIGCGAGHEIVALSAGGVAAFGLDSSQAMVQATRDRCRAQRQPVRVVRGDGHALPFATGAFDGARIERVLQHVESPPSLLSQARRVTRPGGGIVVFEPDWTSLVFDSTLPGVAAAVTAATCATHRQPLVGRELRSLLVEAGFEKVRCEIDAAIWQSFHDAERIVPIRSAVRRAVAMGLTTPDEGAAWLAEQRQLSAIGQFRASLNRVVAGSPIARAAEPV